MCCVCGKIIVENGQRGGGDIFLRKFTIHRECLQIPFDRRQQALLQRQ